jgi:hypothetical protein
LNVLGHRTPVPSAVWPGAPRALPSGERSSSARVRRRRRPHVRFRLDWRILTDHLRRGPWVPASVERLSRRRCSATSGGKVVAGQRAGDRSFERLEAALDRVVGPDWEPFAKGTYFVVEQGSRAPGLALRSCGAAVHSTGRDATSMWIRVCLARYRQLLTAAKGRALTEGFRGAECVCPERRVFAANGYVPAIRPRQRFRVVGCPAACGCERTWRVR